MGDRGVDGVWGTLEHSGKAWHTYISYIGRYQVGRYLGSVLY